jgi:hypothetical protein
VVDIGLTSRCTRSQDDSAAQLAAAFEDLYSYSVSEEPRSFGTPDKAGRVWSTSELRESRGTTPALLGATWRSHPPSTQPPGAAKLGELS